MEITSEQRSMQMQLSILNYFWQNGATEIYKALILIAISSDLQLKLDYKDVLKWCGLC